VIPTPAGGGNPEPVRGQRCSCPSARPGEQANAQLKSWKTLRKIRFCPDCANVLVKAVLVLILVG